MALARLANALRLGRIERAYLFELAGKHDPDQGESESDPIPPSVLACVAAIAAPAYILDRFWTARSWNAKAERLFVGWLDRPADRNLLRFVFLDPAAPALICDYEARARRVVAEFRADVSSHLNDPAIRALIDDLRRQSRAFARFWDEHWVHGREGGERTFNHPADGFLRYAQITFNLASQSEVKLTMLVETGMDAAALPLKSP
jgi:hypothetical protein